MTFLVWYSHFNEQWRFNIVSNVYLIKKHMVPRYSGNVVVPEMYRKRNDGCHCLPFRRTWVHPLSFFFWPLCCLSFFDLWIVITPLVSSNSSCPFVIFLLAIELSVLLRYTDSDYPFGIFKLFFYFNEIAKNTIPSF